MVEALLSFSVFLIIASIFPLLLQMVYQSSPMDKRIASMEWGIFLSQLKKEMQKGENVQALENRLRFTVGEDVVTIERYNNQLRRTVNGQGHETVLQNVISSRFSREGRKIFVEVEDVYGNVNKGTVYSFIDR